VGSSGFVESLESLESFMSDDINNRIDELLVLAALGELSEAENAELDEALAADSDLATDLAADLAVAAQLQSIVEVAPPAAVKQLVMNAIQGVAQDAGPATSKVIPIGSARSRRWQPLAAAAAVAMLFVGGIVAVSRDADPSQFDTVAEQSDAQRRTLTGGLDGTLNVVWSSSAEAFVLAGTGIPVLSVADTYQLWLIDAAGAVPIGTFRPDADGRVEQSFADVDPSNSVLGVTIEPAGGSKQPTLPVVASA
jgi:anti-sigma-K factor RskA